MKVMDVAIIIKEKNIINKLTMVINQSIDNTHRKSTNQFRYQTNKNQAIYQSNHLINKSTSQPTNELINLLLR